MFRILKTRKQAIQLKLPNSEWRNKQLMNEKMGITKKNKNNDIKQ